MKTVAPDGDKWRITLEADLSTSYERGTVIVHGNVALATHGETVQQLLGSGQASTPFQRFTLAHDPLTYVQSSADPSGAVDTLEVRVNDVSAGPRRRRCTAPARRDRVVRGAHRRGRQDVRPVRRRLDAARGSRPASNNVRATYRKGSARPATSARARSRSSSTGRSA